MLRTRISIGERLSEGRGRSLSSVNWFCKEAKYFISCILKMSFFGICFLLYFLLWSWFFKGKRAKPFQLIFIYRRVLKNRPPPAGPQIDLNKLPLRISSSNKKESVHSVTGAIGKTHLNTFTILSEGRLYVVVWLSENKSCMRS